jgi:hypothetical protein
MLCWTDSIRNEEVLQRVKAERNIQLKRKRRKAKWVGHSLRRNCVLSGVIEGKIEGRIEVREDEEEDVSSYGSTLRKRDDHVNWKRQL